MTVDILGLSISFPIIWMIIAIIFAIAEIFTLGLTSIWFTGGALLAMLVSLLGLNLWFQIGAFLLGSILMLIYTKPIAKKVLKIGQTKTNVSSLIGQHGIVTKELQPFTMGHVKVKGQIWSAKPFDESMISVEEEVEILKIEGVKLIVKKLN